MSRRIQRKASFAELQDSSGGFNYILIAMKFAVRTKSFTMNYTRRLLDIGDIIGLERHTFYYSSWRKNYYGKVIPNTQ